MAKLKKSKKWILLLLITFGLALLIFFYRHPQHVDAPVVRFNLDKESGCPGSDYLTNLFERQIGLGHNPKLQQINEKYPGIFYWKLDKALPAFGYPIRSGFYGIVGTSNENVLTISDLFIHKIEPEILKIGFVKNELNTNNLSNNLYGYEKGDTMLTFKLSQGEIYDPNIGMSVSLSCGKHSKEEDSHYLEISKSNEIIAFLKRDRHQNKISDLSIYLGFYSNDLISIFGDSITWFYKKDNKWLEIYSSQDTIPCSILRKYGVGKGVDCFN
ncbi:MAG TPA: hypothetical protein VKC53_03615 [Patescibacteria group bacterium]|nr:hypothetical protein [Patescibacteria group bacterium]